MKKILTSFNFSGLIEMATSIYYDARHYEKKERTRRIMYRQDYIARAMIDVQDVDPVDQGKLKPYFYVGKALNQIDDKEKVKFLRKAERGKHNENEIAFKDPENIDIYDIEKGQIMKKRIIKDIRRGFIFFKNTCKGLTMELNS
ncbi:hypothetical protein Avbf_01234 [Armadillidium vulgare]|nr:hypothetical protein Avbf_01234 [Armadillidium vulgare]